MHPGLPIVSLLALTILSGCMSRGTVLGGVATVGYPRIGPVAASAPIVPAGPVAAASAPAPTPPITDRPSAAPAALRDDPPLDDESEVPVEVAMASPFAIDAASLGIRTMPNGKIKLPSFTAIPIIDIAENRQMLEDANR